MHDASDFRDLVADELAERRADGFDVIALEPEVAAALDASTGPRDHRLEVLLDRLDATIRLPEWRFVEPSSFDDVAALVPALTSPPAPPRAVSDLADQIHGAWLGRCVGNTLGKPVEGWTQSQIHEYLHRAEAYPLAGYIPRLEPWPTDLPDMIYHWPRATLGRVSGQARDDDIDYTLLGLELLEGKGARFTTADVAAQILNRLPFTQVYTAERVAYRNAVNGADPPDTATDRNPYRQWIGALIRADIFGYVCPGDPGRAARMAHRNAVFSHTGNGVYAAMWAAGLIASCFVAEDITEAMTSSMSCIPAESQLADALRLVMERHAEGESWDAALDAIQTRLGHLSWVHAVSNAAVIAAGLLWGDGDFARTVGLTVQGGWDTDSNGATAGSAFGAMHGAGVLPTHMIDPLEDRVGSAIADFDGVAISDLAGRTLRLAGALVEPVV